jgi:serine/threonine protein phosphatase PrpC
MDSEQGAPHWQVVGKSVRGAAHERSGLPNQDAIHWLPAAGCGLAVVLAVADGHGSARYPRSHCGARLAVETATRIIYDFLDSHAAVQNLSLTKRTADEWLPGALVRAWLAAVEDDLHDNPLADEELRALASDAVAGTAYGATMLAAAVSETFVLYLQLGDGDILTVSETGAVLRPLPRDDRLLGNETTSLCSNAAWREFRLSFQPISKAPPALILLTTDGYPNSFRDESGFFKVGSDILEIVRNEGLEKVDANLEGWLRDSTLAGSGDDVTLGLLLNARQWLSGADS